MTTELQQINLASRTGSVNLNEGLPMMPSEVNQVEAIGDLPFTILFHDNDLIAIDKPPGYHVHPPENPQWWAPKNRIVLQILRKQIGKYVYPVHRLDAPTGGVLVFALNKKAASLMCEQFAAADEVVKKYHAIVRGYTQDTGLIDLPLKSDSSDLMLNAQTTYRTIAKTEFNVAVGKRHSSARYSYLEVSPLTGRFHQIRRHLAAMSHPIIGDVQHGDSYHNRFFRRDLQLPGLMLRCQSMTFNHPLTNQSVAIQSQILLPWENLMGFRKNQ